jgi:cathepsin L
MNKILIAVFLLIAVAAARDYRQEFNAWVRKYGKNYGVANMQMRFQVWKRNQIFIDSWNQRSNETKLAMNAFGDLTKTEFSKYYLGLRMNTTSNAGSIITAQPGAPDTMDWRKNGAVTLIKNQEQCGSCWAFSTTGSTEGCHQIKTKNLVSVSEQNLVDCSTSEGNQGCNGGLMTQAMDYIIKNKGIDTEKSYPYTARDGTCKFKAANVGATLTGYSNVQSGSETGLQTAGVSGPVSVAIDASHSSFQFYSSGVYYEPDCSPDNLDHGVLMVGWDKSGSTPYWIVKNSWGTDWGQQGYIWMSRNKNNNCGIATMATLPKC